MGYRIEYDGRIDRYEVIKDGPNRFLKLVLGAFCLFLVGTFCFWTRGEEALRDFLIPGEDAVTVAAFRLMGHDLRSGADLRDAVYTFCRTILYGV